MKKIFSLRTVYFLSICISLGLLIAPSFSSTIRGTGDGFAHKFRTVSFIKSLGEGNIRPRWLMDQAFGYGTPTFIYNFSLPYYIVAGINVFIQSIEKSSQLYAGGIILVTFIAMYLFIQKLYGTNIGVLTALSYVGAPPFLHSIYSWEGWGQMNAYLFPPLILYQVLLLKEKSTRTRALVFVLTWILFINTHNVSAILSLVPLTVILLILLKNTLRKLFFIAQLCISACIISSFFWIPSLFMSGWVQYKDLVVYHAGNRANALAGIQDYTGAALQALTTGSSTFYSFTPGLLIFGTLIITIILFVIFLFQKIVQKKSNAGNSFLYPGVLFLFTSISILLTTDASLPIWKTGIFDFMLLYPSRFLFVLTLTGTLLFGWVIKKITNIWTLLLLSILILLFARPFTNLETTRFTFDDRYFEHNIPLVNYAPGTWMYMGTQEFLPIWMDANFIKEKQNTYFQTSIFPEKIELDASSGTLVSKYISSEHMRFNLKMKKDADIIINTSYYPNWTARINNTVIPVNHDQFGRINIHVPKGEHLLSVTFGYSIFEQLGYIVSLLGVIFLFMILRYKF